VLADFWQPFDATVQAALDVSVTEVIDQLDALLEPMLFPARQVLHLLNCLRFPYLWRRLYTTLFLLPERLTCCCPVLVGCCRSSCISGAAAAYPLFVLNFRDHLLLVQAESEGDRETGIGGSGSAADGGTAEAMAASAAERRRCPSCGGRLGLKLRWGLDTRILQKKSKYCIVIRCLPADIRDLSERQLGQVSNSVLQTRSHHSSPLCAAGRAPSVGCSGYPECAYSRPLDADLGADGDGAASELYAAGATFDVSLTRDSDHAVPSRKQHLKRHRTSFGALSSRFCTGVATREGHIAAQPALWAHTLAVVRALQQSYPFTLNTTTCRRRPAAGRGSRERAGGAAEERALRPIPAAGGARGQQREGPQCGASSFRRHCRRLAAGAHCNA
jgi:ssDNA-binding Zn-finger/Zn-ribbon topoisomerase 1